MRIAALLLLALLAGCGAEPVKTSAPVSSGERGVREAAARYARSVRAGDVHAICTEQVAKELRDRFAAMGADCARDFFGSAVKDGGPRYELVVRSVRIAGDRAIAAVREVNRKGPHDDEFVFVREADGRWRATLTPPAPDAASSSPDQRAIEEAAERYAALIRAGDAQQICSTLVSAEQREQMKTFKADCVRDFYGPEVERGGTKFAFRVGEVNVDGDHAEVLGQAEGVHGPYATTLSFARDADGRWRLAP
jgi:ketosteroid isomerase-like protein